MTLPSGLTLWRCPLCGRGSVPGNLSGTLWLHTNPMGKTCLGTQAAPARREGAQ